MESVKSSPLLWLLDINIANKSLPLSLSLFFCLCVCFCLCQLSERSHVSTIALQLKNFSKQGKCAKVPTMFILIKTRKSGQLLHQSGGQEAKGRRQEAAPTRWGFISGSSTPCWWRRRSQCLMMGSKMQKPISPLLYRALLIKARVLEGPISSEPFHQETELKAS